MPAWKIRYMYVYIIACTYKKILTHSVSRSQCVRSIETRYFICNGKKLYIEIKLKFEPRYVKNMIFDTRIELCSIHYSIVRFDLGRTKIGRVYLVARERVIKLLFLK